MLQNFVHYCWYLSMPTYLCVVCITIHCKIRVIQSKYQGKVLKDQASNISYIWRDWFWLWSLITNSISSWINMLLFFNYVYFILHVKCHLIIFLVWRCWMFWCKIKICGINISNIWWIAFFCLPSKNFKYFFLLNHIINYNPIYYNTKCIFQNTMIKSSWSSQYLPSNIHPISHWVW